MTNPFHELNQIGINYLQNKAYRAAAVSFGRGLNLVKASLTDRDDVPYTDNCKYATAMSGMKEESIDGVPFSNPSNTCPLRAPLTPCRCGCSSCHAKLVFVFVFNLGVSFHLCALASGKNSSRNLSKAQSFYELAQDLCQKENSFAVAPSEEHMALQRNLLHVRRVQEFQERSHHAALQLSAPMPNVNEHNARKMWKGFLSVLFNLCVFDANQTAPAA